MSKAGERFVANETYFSLLVEDALKVGRVALGGNAGLMARHIFRTATENVLLGGIVRDLTRPELPVKSVFFVVACFIFIERLKSKSLDRGKLLQTWFI